MSVFNKQPFYTAYIKYFNTTDQGLPFITWIYSKISNIIVLTPSNPNVNVVIPKDLFVNGLIYGTVVHVSDEKIKENIQDLDEKTADKFLELRPRQYNFKNDPMKKTRYGFIAQEVETLFPEWIETTTLTGDAGETIKTIHTLEVIPLLLMKIQDLQKQVNELKERIL